MKKLETLEQPVGCSLWIVWLVLAMLMIEWSLLSLVFRTLPIQKVPGVALSIIMGSIILAWIAVFIRVERRKHEQREPKPSAGRNGHNAD